LLMLASLRQSSTRNSPTSRTAGSRQGSWNAWMTRAGYLPLPGRSSPSLPPGRALCPRPRAFTVGRHRSSRHRTRPLRDHVLVALVDEIERQFELTAVLNAHVHPPKSADVVGHSRHLRGDQNVAATRIWFHRHPGIVRVAEEYEILASHPEYGVSPWMRELRARFRRGMIEQRREERVPLPPVCPCCHRRLLRDCR